MGTKLEPLKGHAGIYRTRAGTYTVSLYREDPSVRAIVVRHGADPLTAYGAPWRDLVGMLGRIRPDAGLSSVLIAAGSC